MIQWIRTSGLPTKNSLSLQGGEGTSERRRGVAHERVACEVEHRRDKHVAEPALASSGEPLPAEGHGCAARARTAVGAQGGERCGEGGRRGEGEEGEGGAGGGPAGGAGGCDGVRAGGEGRGDAAEEGGRHAGGWDGR